MLTQRLANIVFTVVVVILCVWFAVIAQGFKASGLIASSGSPSKFFPQLTLGFTALCALVVGIRYALRGAAGDDAGQTVIANAGEVRHGLLMLAIAVLCYIIWTNAGFLPMDALLGPLSLLAMGIRSIPVYVTVWVLTALIYAVFTQLLGIQLT